MDIVTTPAKKLLDLHGSHAIGIAVEHADDKDAPRLYALASRIDPAFHGRLRLPSSAKMQLVAHPRH
jgi:hypothetical protein